MTSRPDPLEPNTLLSKALDALPSRETQLESPAAVLTTLIHALLLSLDFKPVAVGGHPSTSDKLPGDLFERQAWNLKYTHPQSSLTFEMALSALGPRLLVNGIAHEDNKTKTMDIVTTDYFSLSSLPISASSSSNLLQAFSSENRLKDLTSLLVASVIRPLAPDLVKGFSSSIQPEPQVDDTRLQQDRTRRGIYPDPAAGPSGGIPSPFPRPEADFPTRPAAGVTMPPIGRSDLDPLAGLDGTTTGRTPLGGLEGDGMILGPNHPLFRDRFAGGGGVGGMPTRGGSPMGPFGGDGFLPSGAVPPGARFDPIVPGPAGRFGPMPGGGGVGGFPGGGRGPIRRGDPDNDEFMPPRNSDYDSMFM